MYFSQQLPTMDYNRTCQYITNPSKICTISIASSKSSIKFSLICTQKSTFMTLYTTVLRSLKSLMNLNIIFSLNWTKDWKCKDQIRSLACLEVCCTIICSLKLICYNGLGRTHCASIFIGLKGTHHPLNFIL